MATPARRVSKLQLREVGPMFCSIDPASFREARPGAPPAREARWIEAAPAAGRS